MAWTRQRPEKAGYYWIIPANPADRLSSGLEPVDLYFDGKWAVFRTGEQSRLAFDRILYWWDQPIPQPDLPPDCQD